MKKMLYTVICSAAAVSLLYASAFPSPAFAAMQTANVTVAAEEITDPETIKDMLSAFIAEKKLNAVCRYEAHYELYPEYDGRVVIEYEQDPAIDIPAVIKEYAISQNILTYCLGAVRLKDGKPYTPSVLDNKKATDAVYAAFDSGAETVPVKIAYQQNGIDGEKLNEDAKNAAAAYAQTLDPARFTADEIVQMQDAYFQKAYGDAYSAELHTRAAEILKALGIAEKDAVIYRSAPYFTCKITREQLTAAEQNPRINRIIQSYTWTYSEEAGTETVSDAETVRSMFTKLIEENHLDAKCVDHSAYADCPEPVIVEWDVIEGGIPAGMILLDFAEKYHIDRYSYTTIALVDGVPQVTVAVVAERNHPGDVNLDNTIDVSDAVLLARFCTEDSKAVITDQGKQNADVNGSGKIDLDDVTAILRKIAKLD